MDKLLELAERCETEAPSYGLNEAVCKATSDESCNYVYRDYVNSLDAAMSLADDGFGSLLAGSFPNGEAGFVAVVTKPAPSSGTAATPALALCAAALRARAAATQERTR